MQADCIDRQTDSMDRQTELTEKADNTGGQTDSTDRQYRDRRSEGAGRWTDGRTSGYTRHTD